MRFWPLVMLVALPTSLYSQSSKPDEGAVERVCGRVTDSEYRSTPWATSYVLGAGSPKKADIYLYPSEGKKKCCAKQTPTAELSTANDGRFEFKDVVPGQYWMIVVVGKKKYKLALTLALSSKKEEDCSDRIFQIKGDELLILRTITLH